MSEILEAVFFDLDGTLVRDGSRHIVSHAADALARQFGLPLDAMLAANADAWQECWALYKDQWMRGQLEEDALPREIWRLTLERIGEDDLDVIDAAVALHSRVSRGAFPLFDEAEEVLRALSDTGVKIGLITNGPAWLQRAKLAEAGVDGWFDVIVASGEVGVPKPGIEIFRRALHELNVVPTRAAHVGDDFAADVVGATDAGMHAIWINREGAPAPRPDIQHVDIPSLRHVLTVVA